MENDERINIVNTKKINSDNSEIVTKKGVKKKTKKYFFSLLIVLLIIFILCFGAIAGIKGRDWLRGQNWYVCLRNNNCNVKNNLSKASVSVSSKDENYSSSSDVSSLYEKVSPAVVTILQYQSNPQDNNVQTQTASASGFVVDSENGLIITNDHVVCGGGKYKVVTKDNNVFNVNATFRDSADDLALIKVDTSAHKLPSQLTFAKDSNQVKPGQFVVAIGNPLGNFPTTVTTGVISGTNRSISASGFCGSNTIQKDYDDVFQTDAAINPGNSGGPLLNINGDVIGVNSATSPDASNISFSIPSNRVIKKLQQYINNGKFQNPFLGVRYSMVDQQTSIQSNMPIGAFIEGVIADSPADKAGIKKNDIITKFGDNNVIFSLQSQISQYDVGSQVQVLIKRPDPAGTYHDVNVTVTLGEQPAN